MVIYERLIALTHKHPHTNSHVQHARPKEKAPKCEHRTQCSKYLTSICTDKSDPCGGASLAADRNGDETSSAGFGVGERDVPKPSNVEDLFCLMSRRSSRMAFTTMSVPFFNILKWSTFCCLVRFWYCASLPSMLWSKSLTKTSD
jgi:hypothetical protein